MVKSQHQILIGDLVVVVVIVHFAMLILAINRKKRLTSAHHSWWWPDDVGKQLSSEREVASRRVKVINHVSPVHMTRARKFKGLRTALAIYGQVRSTVTRQLPLV